MQMNCKGRMWQGAKTKYNEIKQLESGQVYNGQVYN